MTGHGPRIPSNAFGIFRAQDLPKHGFPRTAVYRWAEEGHVQRMLPGIFHDRRIPLTPVTDLAAANVYAARFCPPGAVTGWSALRASGADLDWSWLPPAVRTRHGRPHVAVPYAERVRIRGARLHAVRQPADDLCTQIRSGIVTTDMALAIADLARDTNVPDAAIRAVVDRVRWAQEAGTLELRDRWAELSSFGAGRMRSLVADGLLNHESEAERRMAATLFDGSIPAPDTQVWLTPRTRVDFVYLCAAYVLEYFGEVHRSQFQADHVRVGSLRELGYDVEIITRDRLRDDTGLKAFIQRRRREREEQVRAGLLMLPRLPAPRPRLVPLRTLTPLG